MQEPVIVVIYYWYLANREILDKQKEVTKLANIFVDVYYIYNHYKYIIYKY